MVFLVENVWRNMTGFSGDEVWPHSINCLFCSTLTYNNHVSSPVIIWSRNLNLSPSSYWVRKSRADFILFVLCSSVKTLSTHRAQNVLNPSFWVIVSYETVCNTWGNNCGRSEIVNIQFSFTFLLNKVISHHSRPAALLFVMNVCASVTKQYVTLYHCCIIRNAITIHWTQFTMNLLELNIFFTKKSNYCTDFTVGGRSDCCGHFDH